MGARVMASYGLLGDGKTAVIEMAEASGLPLVPKEQRDPLVATTFGTGELIADAIKRGVDGDHPRHRRLGNQRRRRRSRAGARRALPRLRRRADPRAHLPAASSTTCRRSTCRRSIRGLPRSTSASPATSPIPLCGEKGASRVYGPQKGATPEMVEQLDKNLAHFAHIIKREHRRRRHRTPGAGAGGGIGGGLMAFTNATLKRGVELVVAATRLEDHMQGADLAVTGEGRVDFQTAFGKTPSGVAAAARKHGVPVVAIGGGLADDAGGVFAHGIDGLESATPNAMPLDVAIKKSRQYLQDAAERAARLIVIGQRMQKP